MQDGVLVAGDPVLALRQTVAWGSLVLGVLVLGALLLTSHGHVPEMLATGAVTLVVWGLGSWLAQRRSARGRWDAAPAATSGPVGDRGSAARFVLRRLAVLVPVGGVVLVVITRPYGPVVRGLPWGVLLGGGLSTYLRCRDLVPWQLATGSVLHTRQGARVFAAAVPYEAPRLVRVLPPEAARDVADSGRTP